MNGILALWKDRGMTSHDCVFKLRKLLQTKKIGHTGTLDPDVDGVLPICVGHATKMVEFMIDSTKQYSGEITVGIATTTEDSSGDIVETRQVDVVPSLEHIDRIMSHFQGPQKQTPPMYSAVKVNGKKLYEYARLHQTVERPVRDVTIFRFERVSAVQPHANGTFSFRFEVECSKGTYIRTLAVDLGKALGFPAHMSDLTRTKSAGFMPEQCVTLEQLANLSLSERANKLIPIEQAFFDYPRVAIDEATWQYVKNGAVMPIMIGLNYPVFFHYKGKIVALYDYHPNDKQKIKPRKMLLNNQGEL